MEIKRSEFIKLSTWSFLTFFIPVNQSKAFSFFGKSGVLFDNDELQAFTLAKKAKEYFFKKQYDLAENTYLESIRLAPHKIQFYDGLENVYAAQSKHLLIAELYKNGMFVNMGNPAFYDRTARALMRIELGYKNLATQYKKEQGSLDLLNDANVIINKALTLNPNLKYLQITKQKLNLKIVKNAPSIDYRKHIESKINKKNLRKNHSKRYNKFDTNELLNKLNRIDERKRNTLYFENEIETRQKYIIKEKKKILTTLAYRAKLNQQWNEEVSYRNQIFSLDPQDNYNFFGLKKTLIKLNKFDQLIDLQKIRATHTDSVFISLGLMEAYLLKYKNIINDSSLLNDTIILGKKMIDEWAPVERIKIMIYEKIAEAHQLQGDYEKALNLLTQQMELLKTDSVSTINTLLYRLAHTYYLKNEYDNAEAIINIGLKKPLENKATFKEASLLASKKKNSTFNSDLSLYHLLWEIYHKKGKSDLCRNVIEMILQNNTQNQFALKRI